MTRPAVHLALLEYGLRYNEAEAQWEGIDFVIADDDLSDLSISEIDQVIAGLRDGCDKVTLGKNKYFYLR